MRKRAMGLEFTMRERAMGDHEKKSDEVRVNHD